jgi:hypothetical protein
MMRDARLRRGLTLAEASADTRINPAYLEAIESERWELMPAPVYARGFFRSYARYLGLPPDAIERLVPTGLPRPLDLEPVAGLRKRSPEAPLALPALPALRLPGLPRRPRRAAQSRDRVDRVEGVVRAPAERRVTPTSRTSRVSSSRATFAPLASRARSTAVGLRRATRGLEATRSLEALRRLEPRTALIGAGGFVLMLLLVFAVLRLGGSDNPSSVATSGSGGQFAGPEPSVGATGASIPTAAPFKEGEMPQLAGMSRKDAESTLTGLGLTYVVIEVANAAAEPGTVFNHSPQAGKSIKRGDAVTLLISRAP